MNRKHPLGTLMTLGDMRALRQSGRTARRVQGRRSLQLATLVAQKRSWGDKHGHSAAGAAS